jgi:hypothetical protein
MDGLTTVVRVTTVALLAFVLWDLRQRVRISARAARIRQSTNKALLRWEAEGGNLCTAPLPAQTR